MPRPSFRLTLVAAAAVLATAACTRSVFVADPPAEDSPLFEVEYRNSAWGVEWKGFYVDAQGRVYAYDLGPAGEAAYGDSVLAPAQIAAKYDHARRLVKTLPAGEAASMYELVSPAAAGDYTERRNACADAGGQRYSAWIWQESDGRFHRLLLHVRGDWAQANRSSAATTLYHWLEDVTGTAGGGCDPFD